MYSLKALFYGRFKSVCKSVWKQNTSQASIDRHVFVFIRKTDKI